MIILPMRFISIFGMMWMMRPYMAGTGVGKIWHGPSTDEQHPETKLID
jgi:hypothetical protein